MIRTYKRKLILNKAQKDRIDSWIGACRFVYNMALEIKVQSYRVQNRRVSKFELMRQITEIRDVSWIGDVPSQTLQNVIERLDMAYNQFFRTVRSGGGFPGFANKRKYKSILFKRLRVEQNYVTLPKIGKLKMFKDSPIIGVPKTATIIKEPTGYFICIQCEGVPNKFNSESQAVGIDMGISHFCITSDGCFVPNPRHFKKYERKLRVENRSLTRKKKWSYGWKKQASKVAKLHHTIANVRRDFLHKESTKLAKLYSTIYMEDLNINGMVRSKTISKHILDCGWGMFREMLTYKTSVLLVNPNHTSQECHECGNIDKENRLSQSEFVCKSCGHTTNADHNAALNILSRGAALSRQREPLGCA